MKGVYYVVSELAIGGNIDPLSIEHQAIFLLPFLMVQTFASVQLLQCSDDQILPISTVVDPSPSMVTWEGLSPFAVMDSLGSGICQGVSADASAQLGQNCLV